MQEVFTIPLSKLNGWLFSINPNKVKPEVKTKLIEYKNECFDVLYKHFNKTTQPQQPTPKIKELQNIILEQNRIIANTSTDKEIKELKNTIEKQNKIIQTLTDKSYQYCLDVKQMLTNISKQYANDINSLEIQTSQIQAKELAPLLN